MVAALTAIGLMSGTSLDGVDAALAVTDGARVTARGPALTLPYPSPIADGLRAALGQRDAPPALVRAMTETHATAVRMLLKRAALTAEQVAVVGFHGHTIWHDPGNGVTRQIGDAAWLAAALGIDVVADFRSADIAAGGEGAPLAPLYHRALAASAPAAADWPVCMLNLGGVGNVTWIGAARAGQPAGADASLLAFDTGPGNALIDDWALRHTGTPMDKGGALAAAGRVDEPALAALLDHPFFDRVPPKSLDRLDFRADPVAHLSPADGAATLTAFTAASVARALRFLPAPPRRWWVTGGGRHNPILMGALAARLAAPVAPVEAAGWDGDALEAEAFAFLAVRSLRGLPLSLPKTTGAAAPTHGGRLFKA